MINSVLFDWFGSTSKMLIFLAGMALATAALAWDARRRHIKLNYQPVGIFGGVAVMVFMVLQSMSVTYQLQQCSAEFQQALNVRSASNKAINQLTVDWLSDFARPPARVADLPITDPVRVAWFRGTFDRYRIHLDAALRDLDAHPFPPPKCGKTF